MNRKSFISLVVLSLFTMVASGCGGGDSAPATVVTGLSQNTFTFSSAVPAQNGVRSFEIQVNGRNFREGVSNYKIQLNNSYSYTPGIALPTRLTASSSTQLRGILEVPEDWFIGEAQNQPRIVQVLDGTTLLPVEGDDSVVLIRFRAVE